jgi:hypothetical protein
MRLAPDGTPPLGSPKKIDALFSQRRGRRVLRRDPPAGATAEEKNVQRQAFAGMLWSKQSYLFDVALARRRQPEDCRRRIVAQAHPQPHWRHLNSMRVLSMPDKWEYPWFAAWDLAFHTCPRPRRPGVRQGAALAACCSSSSSIPTARSPPTNGSSRTSTRRCTRGRSGASTTWTASAAGKADRAFLEKCFHKLLINFAWWVNKVDRQGNNVFEGGFLGLDNITVVDRSEKLPDGASSSSRRHRLDGPCSALNMMRIALELAKENRTYEGLATKFFEHYVYIGAR